MPTVTAAVILKLGSILEHSVTFCIIKFIKLATVNKAILFTVECRILFSNSEKESSRSGSSKNSIFFFPSMGHLCEKRNLEFISSGGHTLFCFIGSSFVLWSCDAACLRYLEVCYVHSQPKAATVRIRVLSLCDKRILVLLGLLTFEDRTARSECLYGTINLSCVKPKREQISFKLRWKPEIGHLSLLVTGRKYMGVPFFANHMRALTKSLD